MSNLFITLKKYARKKMDQVPLWAEFTLFMAMILILLTFLMSWNIYRREQNRTMEAETKAAHSLLHLRMANMEEYIDALSSFAIQPVYNSDFYSMLLTKENLSDAQLERIRSTVRSYFYARSDLLSYHIYIKNQNLSVGRAHNKEGVRFKNTDDISKMDEYEACQNSVKNYALLPSDNEKAMFKFAHSIIRIEDKSIVAIAEFEVNDSGISYLSSQTIGANEILSLYNSEGELLYTTGPDEVKRELGGYSTEENLSKFLKVDTSKDEVFREIAGERYLLAVASDEDHELYMTSMEPVSDILSQLKQTRSFAIAMGMIFLIFAVVAGFVLIKYLSQPLTELVKIQEQYGEGQISDLNLGRSRESAELSRSFNEMTRRIDTLLQENYVAELNEKNARLAALEAQINPHFLYNTLQAIGSEALINDQTEIYTMLTGLASNLRYSIKAENVVSMQDELKYVENYIMLQKCRMGNKLVVKMDVQDSDLEFPIPKLSIQTLIENSIIHGIGGEKTSIHINLKTLTEDSKLKIIVKDDGVGIPEEELQSLRKSFRTQTLSDKNRSIGLANLYNRLLILYGGEAALTIDSETGRNSYTCVTMEIAGGEDVQDAHN